VRPPGAHDTPRDNYQGGDVILATTTVEDLDTFVKIYGT
jgi:hypothetical protein